MAEKLLVFVLIFIQLSIADTRNLRKADRAERAAYLATMLVILYLASIYIFDKNWLNYNDIINLIFLAPAEKIVNTLKGSS
ncbi:hypothetical protein ABE504_17475 [Paenibacillus oryzisoli]|uniref:hypothetical protein n=1 Tax=Paenibacillus oryzisoli TaxID=1850517 RepID=UPI003D26AB33